MAMDLILRGGRVIDPARGIDGTHDVGFAGGRVATVAPRIAEKAKAERDVAGLLVLPGLIDLHTHVYWGGTSIGVEAEPIARRSGTTTFVDAGTAGPGNFPGFRRHVIEPSPLRILAYLNLSFAGIFAFSRTVMVGESSDIRLLDLGECVRVARENRDLVVGIKVRVGRVTSNTTGIMPLDMAVEVADELGLPIMAHIDQPPPSRKEVLERLRPGDVLTHCYRPFPNSLLRADGAVREEALQARERGVIFDLGHGAGSFGFHACRGLLAAGFRPDVISSDVHVLNVDGPVFDLLTTMSKFLALGMDLATLVEAVTAAPARAIGRPSLGSLAPGSEGDATIVDFESGAFEFRDALGERLDADRRLKLAGMVVGGKWWPDA
ncbi:MAG: amidohydrolase/deacetylase family metallohydrolase [Alphaproteobacteria bacterium]|nr:amidohydrolase/deacetylase family metallohydrolase [Alphaproteobacteria bacterium]